MSTALDKYQRLEATALWRATPEDQRRDTIVSIGDATLVISDMRDQALTHWSIPAVRRLNPGTFPAIYYPDGDPGETLEIGKDETQMVEAIEKLRAAVTRKQPRPGRLRFVALLASLTTVALLAVFWLPGVMMAHTLKVVPDATRDDIGTALQTHAVRVTGHPCGGLLGSTALRKLETRLGIDRLVVVPSGVRHAVVLPGKIVLVSRNIVEDFEEPDVLAGFVVAALLQTGDPLERVLESLGMAANFRLLTTGIIPEDQLRHHAEDMVLAQIPRPEDDALIAAFEENRLRISPYAYAIDPTGEETLSLIEADPFTTTPEPVLGDGDWVALQGICGG